VRTFRVRVLVRMRLKEVLYVQQERRRSVVLSACFESAMSAD